MSAYSPYSRKIRQALWKLDLSGAQGWADQESQKILTEYHNLFALDDPELGKTSLVKHSIKLLNEIPFEETYQRILPHQYEEVKRHLKEMMKIGSYLEISQSMGQCCGIG